jgi:hypothetical protein
MKNLILIFIAFLLFENANSQNLPQVSLECVIVKAEAGQDESYGSNDEVKINLYIDGLILDSYFSYGTCDYYEDSKTLYVNSDISEKSYEISVLNDYQIEVAHFSFFEGMETEVWKKYMNRIHGT